jgi:RNA recognition motif-containing protein
LKIAAETVSEKYLNMQFHQYGPIAQIALDRDRGHALVFFEQLSCAQMAVKDMRGTAIRGRKLQIDFASRECQEAFYSHLEKSGPVEKPWDRRASLVVEPPFEPARYVCQIAHFFTDVCMMKQFLFIRGFHRKFFV